MLKIDSIKHEIITNTQLPEEIVNVIKCKNPRCITTVEKYVPQRFYLANRSRGEYRCKYCDEAYKSEI
ncbi:hypothetical protein [Clostridium colicanis]|uniref:Aspartate carbamoyltransferase regulatory chain n=1 Tax=Clostridium colicanis DSM 13634 TaxID=1121305 RepID=A0A151ANQ8_9CLOT|nr:aspartate carbamoyltransferase regulatory chain [Clostridium colicanis DSM 13634]